jgi:hypothetical protein
MPVVLPDAILQHPEILRVREKSASYAGKLDSALH